MRRPGHDRNMNRIKHERARETSVAEEAKPNELIRGRESEKQMRLRERDLTGRDADSLI